MSNLPKLKVKKHFGGYPLEGDICDLAQAKDILFHYWPSEHWAGVLVAVDGQLVRSYEELVKLISQGCYKDKEFVEVGIYPQAGGG